MQSYLQRKNTNLRLAVSVEASVAVTLWRLATNSEYRTIAELGCSTVGEIVLDTYEMIVNHLFHHYVYIPQGDRFHQVIEDFETQWGFPQVTGAVDGTHIPIIKPNDSASDYFSRKGFDSVIMQAVVDSSGLFLDAYIGWPGKLE